MIISRRAAPLLALLAALLACAAHARAQDAQEVSVKAEIQRTRAYVGDRVIYQVTVEGSDSPQTPTLDLPDGVTATALGGRPSQHSFQAFINGRRIFEHSVSFIFQYEITPQAEGVHTIGPATVIVDGVEHTTNRVRFTAVNPQDASQDAPLIVEPESDELWVGQAIRARVTWLFDEAAGISFEASSIPASFTVLENNTPPAGAQASEMQWMQVLGQNLIAAIDVTRHEGRPVRRLTFDLLLQPTRPGDFDLGPLAIVFDRSVPGLGRVRSIARSQALPVTVRPLPAEGRPEGFAGAIGRYTLSTQASAGVANVGDPIELTLSIQGPEPMPGVTTGPDLGRSDAFAARFRLASDGWERIESNTPGLRTFRTTIRPLSPDVTEIPPIQLPYFDVDAGQYRVAASDPIPLEVRAVRQVTAADAVVSALPAQVNRSPLSAAGAGIWAPDRGPALLRSTGFDLSERLTQPLWLGLLVVPPCLWAAVGARKVLRATADPDRARRRRALARAQAELSRSGPGAAARRLLADLLAREPSSITAADAAALPLDPARRDALRALLESEEATRYGALPPSAADTRKARRVLRDAYAGARAAR